MENKQQPSTSNVQPTQPIKRPDDVGSITVTGLVRIFDPRTQETFVEKRT